MDYSASESVEERKRVIIEAEERSNIYGVTCRIPWSRWS